MGGSAHVVLPGTQLGARGAKGSRQSVQQSSPGRQLSPQCSTWGRALARAACVVLPPTPSGSSPGPGQREASGKTVPSVAAAGQAYIGTGKRGEHSSTWLAAAAWGTAPPRTVHGAGPKLVGLFCSSHLQLLLLLFFLPLLCCFGQREASAGQFQPSFHPLRMPAGSCSPWGQPRARPSQLAGHILHLPGIYSIMYMLLGDGCLEIFLSERHPIYS